MNPVSKSRKWLLRTAVLLALAVAAGLVFTLVTSAPRRALPNPNGYDDFLKAGAGVINQPVDYTVLDHDGLSRWVTTNAESLRLVRLGLTRGCSVPTDAVIANPGANLASLASLKRLVFLLAAEGRLAEMEGRTNDAVNSYLDAMRYGNEISRGGMMINRLVGVACEATGYSGLVALVPRLDCAQSRPVIAALAKLDETGVTWAEVNGAEGAYRRHYFLKSNLITWIPQWWQARAAGKKAAEKHYRMLAKLRLLEVELALRCYRAEHGVAPQRIEDLVPGQLQSVPLDPFSGEILAYRATGTNWLLYSFGVDRVDDGGKAVGKSVSGSVQKGDLYYDSPW